MRVSASQCTAYIRPSGLRCSSSSWRRTASMPSPTGLPVEQPVEEPLGELDREHDRDLALGADHASRSLGEEVRHEPRVEPGRQVRGLAGVDEDEGVAGEPRARHDALEVAERRSGRPVPCRGWRRRGCRPCRRSWRGRGSRRSGRSTAASSSAATTEARVLRGRERQAPSPCRRLRPSRPVLRHPRDAELLVDGACSTLRPTESCGSLTDLGVLDLEVRLQGDLVEDVAHAEEVVPAELRARRRCRRSRASTTGPARSRPPPGSLAGRPGASPALAATSPTCWRSWPASGVEEELVEEEGAGPGQRARAPRPPCPAGMSMPVWKTGSPSASVIDTTLNSAFWTSSTTNASSSVVIGIRGLAAHAPTDGEVVARPGAGRITSRRSLPLQGGHRVRRRGRDSSGRPGRAHRQEG